MPPKRYERGPVEFLTAEETAALLSANGSRSNREIQHPLSFQLLAAASSVLTPSNDSSLGMRGPPVGPAPRSGAES